MRYTQQILGRKKPALEAEEVVDQSVIDSLPAETETPAEAEAPVDDVVAEATEPTEPAEEPAVPVEGEATDLPAEEPVSEPVADEPGAGEIVPPDAEAVDVAPTTADGSVTVDQVESVLAGNEPEAAEAVAEADTLAGEPTTPEEVVAETDEVQEALGDDAAATELPSEPGLPSDEPGADLPVEPIEPGTDGAAVDEPVVDAGTEEPLSDEPAAVDAPGADPMDATDGVEGGEPAALEDGQMGESPAPSEAPLPGADPATEGCACEEGDLGAQDVIAAQVDEAEAPVGAGEGVAQTDVPIEGAGTETLGEPGADPIAEPATDEVVADDDNYDFEPHVTADHDEAEGQVLEEAMDTYPQVTAILEESLDNGGISNEAMQLLNIFTKRDGIPVNSNVSLESYNHTARTQTRVALEGLKENMKEWLGQFIEWLKKTAQQLVDWVTAQFSRVDRLLESADKLEKADLSAASTGGTVTGTFLNRVKVDGGFNNWTSEARDTISTLIGYMTIFCRGALDLSQQTFDALRTNVLAAVVKGESLGDPKNLAKETIWDPANQKCEALMKQCDIAKDSSSATGGEYLGIELLGDLRLKLTTSVFGLPRAAIINKGTATPESAPALSPDMIKGTAREVIRLLNTVKKSDDMAGSFKSQSEKIVSELERLKSLSDNSGEKGSDASSLITLARSTIADLSTFSTTTLSTSMNLAMGISTGILGYLQASAGATDAAAAPAAAEEPAKA